MKRNEANALISHYILIYFLKKESWKREKQVNELGWTMFALAYVGKFLDFVVQNWFPIDFI